MSNIMQQIGNITTAAKDFVRLVQDPESLAKNRALQTSLEQLSTPEAKEKVLNAFRSAPSFSEILASRYRAPQYQIEDLKGCPPDSLGYAYYRFMTEHGLSQNYVHTEQDETEMGYLHERGQETHDIWHTVLGYQPDFPGEVGVQSFVIGQIVRCVQSERVGASMFMVMLQSALLLHILLYRPPHRLRSLKLAVDGLRRGLAARPLWAARWEEMWNRPLSEVRAEYLGSAQAA